MKKFFLVVNPRRTGTHESANQIEKLLIEKGATCSRSIGYAKKQEVPEGTECIITLGGDGTIIHMAREMAGEDVRLIGVNKGHMGYLTSVDSDAEVEPMIDALIEDRYTSEPRMMLETSVSYGGHSSEKYYALNDVCLKSLSVKMIGFKLYVNHEFLNEYFADGIIIATPTGSTAYNLNAGGPIIEPTAQMIVITPLCANVFSKSSIVFSANDVIDIEVTRAEDKSAVIFDGDIHPPTYMGSHIRIQKSEKSPIFVNLHKSTFLQHLRAKMNVV